MKKRALIVLNFAFVLLFMFVASIHAYSKVDLFGYYESQVMGAKVKDSFYQLYANKLRVDLKSDFSSNVTFAANFDYITYHGKKQWNILDFLSSEITSQVPDALKPLYVIPFSNRHFLDNAYLRLSFKPFDLTLGKQQISLGTGYVWNPVDVFNIKDILDPTYEQPGHNAMRMDVPIGLASTATALYAPGEEWKNSSKMLLFKTRVSRFDLSVIGIEKTWRFHDYTVFDPAQMSFLELPEKRRLLGASTAGQLLGLGVWAEFAYNWMDQTDDFYELVVGTDYTFDFQTYFLVEYYRNTLGKKDYRDYTINDWMRNFAQEQKAVSRDQVYALVQHPATDLMTVSLSSIISISDHSMALVPTVMYSFSQNVDIFAYLNLNVGKEGTYFANTMGNGGFVRVRVYF
ncbi:MAG: hypothetical protein GF421_00745 [Candidatus Aminicenantes bacterium]|nr:hypothetical protein [Candidatus Aminicenantes bacterium]